MKSSIFLAVCFSAVLVMNCSRDDDAYSGELTASYFKEKINADMSYDQLIRSFGEPVKDMGSGIHIYVYTLTDSTEVWIGFTDMIVYANHMSKDQQLLSVII